MDEKNILLGVNTTLCLKIIGMICLVKRVDSWVDSW